jgi:hypothetical protein
MFDVWGWLDDYLIGGQTAKEGTFDQAACF